jgi:C1A family cysteine protease
MRTIKRLGWIPDLPDHRDLLLAPRPVTARLPKSVDLRPQCQPVWDQGNLGSCTAHGSSFVDQFVQTKEGLPVVMPARLQVYYCTRMIEGTVDTDSGAMVRDALKAIAKYGVAPESAWPYKVSKFAVRPPASVIQMAAQHVCTQYMRLTKDLGHLKQCLADGYPFTFGFTVYDSFESDAVAASGIVPMPAKTESVLGGHCVAAVGYQDNRSYAGGGYFIVRNSWGLSWGQQGHCFMPYAYVTGTLASDFWTIRKCA